MKKRHASRSLLGVSAMVTALLAPSTARAQVDPDHAFYAIAFTHGTPHNGVITVQSTASPYGVIATAERGTVNGSISLDPVRRILYGGSCCTENLPIQAYDPATLMRVATRDITVTSSGSLAFEVDAPRRVIFFYDTVARTLRAISLGEGANYGRVVASVTLTDLPAEPVPTSVGDQLAIDTRGQQVFVTGGDGGPVLAVDVSRITVDGGTFGAVANTGQRNRATGNSGGGVAVDEDGRRVFFFQATGTVRMIRADAPFAMVGDIPIATMAANDCGLFFDARVSNLYVGRGAAAAPVVVSFPSTTVTPFTTGPGDVPALSFAGATTACVDRDSDGFPSSVCAPPGARADCDDTQASVNPDARETCNSSDDDCDGLVDEGFCHVDGSCAADGAPNPANACQTCVAPSTASGPSSWSNRPMGAVCRTSAGACDVAEACDGMGAPCPADVTLPSSTVCRPSAGACDVAERCTGTSAPCPADAFLMAGTVCRASVSIMACDPAEVCTGAAAPCPMDVVTRSPGIELCNGIDDDCDGMIDEPPCMPMVDAGPMETGVVDSGPIDTGAADAPDDRANVDADVSAPEASVDVSANDNAPVVDVVTPTQDAPAAQDVVLVQDGGVEAGDASGMNATQSNGCGCAVPGGDDRDDGRSFVGAFAAFALMTRRRRR